MVAVAVVANRETTKMRLRMNEKKKKTREKETSMSSCIKAQTLEERAALSRLLNTCLLLRYYLIGNLPD